MPADGVSYLSRTGLADTTQAAAEARIIVIGNEKGGAGKSTVSIHLSVALLAVGKRVEQTSELVRLEALAAKDLQERLPGMLTRQALRLVTKEQVRRTAAKEGGDVGNILVGIFNTLSERADTRSWLTLPAEASSWQEMLPAGEVQLQLGAGSAMRTLPLTVHGGRTTLVWVQRLGNRLTTRVMPL